MARTFDLKALRRRMVDIDFHYHHNHLGGALSALPIITSVYETFDFVNDIFILSKGHASSALYAVLEACGYHPDVTRLHPDRDPANGITCTTGSLGHGLPMAVGFALAKTIKGEPGIVHVLIGDGEAMEGSNFEALYLIYKCDLFKHIVLHIDVNGYQSMGRAMAEPALAMALLGRAQLYCGNKGYGVSLYASHPEWHSRPMTQAEYDEIQRELA